jgi:cbb3-type cytochrome oxidase subunit 3
MSSTTYGWVAGISTLISMLAFLGVVAWSYNRRRGPEYNRAALMPLEEDINIKTGAQS